MTQDPFELLPKHDPFNNDSDYYDLKEVKELFPHLRNKDNTWVFVKEHENKVTLDFCVFESAGSYNDSQYLKLIFRGWGTGASLRECRHTHWGEDQENPGYIFYPNPAAISNAFELLKEWFDFD